MPGVEDGLEEGMVINVEVGYYLQGVAGFLCEDTMIVRGDGCELLTHNSKSLVFEEYI
jgi:Xaa-Pro aminopeptidase